MKKKLKLFCTIATLCLSISMLVFGVFSAFDNSFKTFGKLSYEIEDTFVEIETRVYSTAKKFNDEESLKAQSVAFENSTFTELENTVTSGLIESQTTYDFNKVQIKNINKGEDYTPTSSDYKNTYSSVIQQDAPEVLQLYLDYSMTDEIYTYFVVTRIVNKSIVPIYASVINQGDDKYVAAKNSHNYKLNGYKELANLDDEVYMVFALSLDNISSDIVDAEFVFPIHIANEIDLEQFLVVEAEETVYTTQTQITAATDLKPQVDKIINGTQQIETVSDDLSPASYGAIQQISSQIHTYDTATGFVVNGTFTPPAQYLTNNSTFFIVADIKNSGLKTVYTKIKSATKSISGMYNYISDGNLKLLAGQSQKIVFAYNVNSQNLLPDDLTISFVIEATETEYSYAQIEREGGGFLARYELPNGDSKYSNKIKTYTFTNNSADFDATKVTDTYKVGKIYNEDGSVSDLYAYFIPNKQLFDVYVYAPVNTIYAPVDCNGLFSRWYWLKGDDDDISEESYEPYWINNNLEEMYFKNFDTSKTVNFYGMFGVATNLKRIYGLNTFDTSKGQSFLGMFMGCESLEELDLSSFSFESVPDISGVIGLLGTNDVYMTTLFGAAVSPIVNASTLEEKIYETAKFLRDVLGMEGPTARSAADSMYYTKFQKIICPKDLKQLIIALPGNGTWANQQRPDETTSFLLNGNKILIYSE